MIMRMPEGIAGDDPSEDGSVARSPDYKGEMSLV